MIPICNCNVCRGDLPQPKCENARENRVVGEIIDRALAHQRRVLSNRDRIHRALTRAFYCVSLRHQKVSDIAIDELKDAVVRILDHAFDLGWL